MASTAEPEHSSTSTSTSTVHQGSQPRRLHVPALRQLYSRVALRGRRKSTATESTVSSRPVVVRTYSPASRRSRASRSPSSAREQPSSSCRSAMHASPRPPPHLPPTADFSFAGILHAVEPEISGAIDAIAAICARSRLCLADEYAAHRPPHEVLDPGNPIPLPPSSSCSQRQRQRPRWWSVVRDTALAAVPEASSSSERLTGSRTASRASLNSTAGQSAKGAAAAGTKNASAYGSLKSFVSGDGSGSERRRKGLAALFGGAADAAVSSHQGPLSSASDWTHAQWMVSDDGSGAVRLSPASAARAASPRVALAVTEAPVAVKASSSITPTADASSTKTTTTTTLHPSPPTTQLSRSRSSSSPSWLPSWGSGTRIDGAHPSTFRPAAGTSTLAEQRLKWLLEASSAALSGAAAGKLCGGQALPP
ncbi:hypothetical protein IWX90DRAFT_136036 [Phyllosticta citrichinensis]|uniref:Uncharacterized protein n=1 Tax=Phyllosticta citrichinensis TaxID=1130410 RepID=A0ABR1XXZ5_9PEZI